MRREGRKGSMDGRSNEWKERKIKRERRMREEMKGRKEAKNAEQ